MAKINAFHVSLFAYFLAEVEGDAGRRRLAARSFAVSLRQRHGQSRRARPHQSADPGRRRRCREVEGGRHIRYAEPTPLANLHLTLLDKVGVRLDSFADSKAKVERATAAPIRMKAIASLLCTIGLFGAGVKQSQPDGTTALHRAADRDDVQKAGLLIRDGADVKAANRYGVTPLSLACTNGSAAMIKLLLKAGADPNTAFPGGETALMTASRTGKLEAVKELLAAGANVNATEEKRGQNALMWAAAEGNTSVVEELLKSGADLHGRLGTGFTAFLFAVREGQADMVRTLLKAGADANETIQTTQSSGPRPASGAGVPRAG